jgi:hypothetical protein
MQHPIDATRTANLAYALWQERGRPVGSPETDWLAAEAMLHSHAEPELEMSAVDFEASERPF